MKRVFFHKIRLFIFYYVPIWKIIDLLERFRSYHYEWAYMHACMYILLSIDTRVHFSVHFTGHWSSFIIIKSKVKYINQVMIASFKKCFIHCVIAMERIKINIYNLHIYSHLWRFNLLCSLFFNPLETGECCGRIHTFSYLLPINYHKHFFKIWFRKSWRNVDIFSKYNITGIVT